MCTETHLRVDMRYDTTLGDDDISEELVQSFEILKQGKTTKFTRLTLHHFGWQAVSAEARYAASCCPVLRYQPTPKSQQRDTQGQPQGRLRGSD